MRKLLAPLLKGLAFVLVTTVATALLALSISNVGVSERTSYSARFTDVTSLNPGDDVRIAGVRVGELEYPAFPGGALGIDDPAVRVAFYALLHNQDLNTPMSVFATDVAGNTATAPITSRVFLSTVSSSTLEPPESTTSARPADSTHWRIASAWSTCISL